jgi:lipopolysaccharide export system permease protein
LALAGLLALAKLLAGGAIGNASIAITNPTPVGHVQWQVASTLPLVQRMASMRLTRIDRYLAGQFSRAFLIFLVSFTGLYVVIDAFGNLDEFVTYGERLGGLAGVLAEYYGYRSLTFFNLMSNVVALIAAMFTVTGFQRHHEMTALLAAGISKRRIVTPILLAGGAVSLLAVLNRELILPAVRHKLDRNAQDWLGETARPLRPRYDYRTNVYLAGQSTVARDRRIEKPGFRLPPTLDDYGDRVTADRAYYRPATGDRRGGYLFVGVKQPPDLAHKPSLAVGGETVLFTPRDAPWLAPDECFVASDVTFEQLEGGRAWRQLASTRELIAGIQNDGLEFGADVRVAVHARFVQPLLDLTLLFLGLPLVLTRESRNPFAAIGLCALVVAGFLLVVVGCHYLGTTYWLDPAQAAWLPAMVFVPLAAALSAPLRE